MLVIPSVVIKEQEFTFTHSYDPDHISRLNIWAVGSGGSKCTFDIDNINLLTKCAIIDLVYKKVEECLQ